MVRCFLLFSVLLVISGCGLRDRIVGAGAQADGAVPFNAKLSKSEDRRDFTVRVRAGGASVDQVRESVRFEATGYCLSAFGGSETRWAIDPVTGDWAFSRDEQDMIFSGRCTTR